MNNRLFQLQERFNQTFPQNQYPTNVYSAPGRTEISGNHTDHQHGRVLAGAINLDMLAVASKRADQVIQLDSEGFALMSIDLNDLSIQASEKETSQALIRGICARFAELGYQIGGLNITMTSDVLEGSGLSSSAAFEVLIATILNYEYNQGVIFPQELATIAQYSENQYFGKPCGLMDQMASAVGSLVMIDFKDNNQPLIEKLDVTPMDFGYELCIVDTKGSHANLTEDYASIPREMKQVANFFGHNVLREVDEQAFYSNITQVRKTCGDRAVLRAFHFFQENRRVYDLVNALKQSDIKSFLRLIKESGDSSYRFLQNVIKSDDSTHQQLGMAIAMSEKILHDQGVVRVHGGGFAGTIQAFVATDFVDTYKEEIEKIFGEGSCHILTIRAEGGIQLS